ncbi:siderophore-interacting protein [Nesterenkonia sp. CL21]|uniref:siderophore-interacting protein n=1 Tax=Nesterenkonia sp. CL21 TaxID=3064894 RepID=UPI00287A932E|nr:siderophore-interacting protein [Nesterenkonia sp. CL21]MDS2173044.1 siderophore-interacting protein [Nesterenkonia sp. CL21]
MSAQPVDVAEATPARPEIRAVEGSGRRATAPTAPTDGSTAEARPIPATRAFRTTVADVLRLSPHFIRVTVTAEDLRHFYTGGLDQRIKVFLPRADGEFPEIGLFADPAPTIMEWYHRWRELDDAERNPIRTYTVRAIRPEQREIDIDFVVHGTEGPASAWVSAARPGDELIVIGPDGRSDEVGAGIEWNPGTARDVLLAGDETAVPAMCAILESLPEGITGEAYLEVPSSEDALEVTTRCGVTVHWLGRDGAPLGERLTAAVEDWARRREEIFAARQAACEPARAAVGAPDTGELPEVSEDAVLWEVADPEGFREYAWLAGEAGVITGLRRHLVKGIGMSRKQVSFMGYWKAGRASA